MKRLFNKLKVILVLMAGMALLAALVPTPVGACDDCTCFDDPVNDGGTWYLRGDNVLSQDDPDAVLWPDFTYIKNGNSAFWYSDPTTGEVIYPDTDHWNLYLRYINYCKDGTLTATLYSIDDSGVKTALAQGTEILPARCGIQCTIFTLNDLPGPQTIPYGHRLALELSYIEEGGGMLALYDSSFACSRLEGDPPVPELSTILLMGLGILGLGGYIVLRNRKQEPVFRS